MLKAYVAWSGPDPMEGACLAFANSHKEAKKLAWPIVKSWDFDAEWTWMHVCRLQDAPDYIMAEATQVTPHVIERPRSCNSCGQWGHSEIGSDGKCDLCAGRKTDDE
jgi:hypothetical protein